MRNEIEIGYDISVDPNELRSNMFLLIRDLELREVPRDVLRAYIAAFDIVLSWLGEDCKVEKEEEKDGKQENVHDENR